MHAAAASPATTTAQRTAALGARATLVCAPAAMPSMPPAPICLGIRPDETPSRRTARAATMEGASLTRIPDFVASRAFPVPARLSCLRPPVCAEQGAVEEGDDAPLVLGRAGRQATGVPSLGDHPDRLGLTGRSVVLRVEILGVDAVGGVDQKDGTRRDLADEILEVRRWGRVGEDGGAGADHRGDRERHEPVVDARPLELLSDRPGSGALRNDGLEVIVVRRSLQEQLPADGEPEPADAVRADVRPPSQVCDRGRDVLAAVPTEAVGITPLSPSPRRSKSRTP